MAYSEACVYEAGRLLPATFTLGMHLPLTDNLGLLESPVPFVIEYEGGKLNVCASHFPTMISSQYTTPYEMYIGRRQHATGPTRSYIEQGARFTLDDGVVRSCKCASGCCGWHGGHCRETCGDSFSS